MSLLSDARRLLEELGDDGPRLMWELPSDMSECALCEVEARGHKPDCPWLSMPRIVAALEAAERMAEIDPKVNLWSHSGQDYWCYACDALLSPWDGKGEEPHKQDCPQQALVAALKGR